VWGLDFSPDGQTLASSSNDKTVRIWDVASGQPIGQPFTGRTVDTDKIVVHDVTLEPATETEIADTVKVMGGEDWQQWIDALAAEGLLAEGCKTVAYSYIGPELTFPIYHHGTIGRAKAHLDATAANLRKRGIEARVAVNKAVVTQASSAIPVVPLYISLLFRIMKARGTHEGTIEQMDRLLRDNLYGASPNFDADGRLRVDDLEMHPEVQRAVAEVWPTVTTENLREVTDFDGYQADFLRLFGFGLDGVDYDADVEVERDIA